MAWLTDDAVGRIAARECKNKRDVLLSDSLWRSGLYKYFAAQVLLFT